MTIYAHYLGRFNAAKTRLFRDGLHEFQLLHLFHLEITRFIAYLERLRHQAAAGINCLNYAIHRGNK